METMSKQKAIQILQRKNISLFDINDAHKIFPFQNKNSLYNLLKRLEKADILKRVANGKYMFSFKEVNDFELANFLINISYISLESALSLLRNFKSIPLHNYLYYCSKN